MSNTKRFKKNSLYQAYTEMHTNRAIAAHTTKARRDQFIIFLIFTTFGAH